MIKFDASYLWLAILAVLSWVGAAWMGQDDEIKVVVASNEPDYFSHGYQKKEMSVEGLVKNEIVADKMFHLPETDQTHLFNPVMILYHSVLPPWVIESEKGILEADGDHLFLQGQVRIHRDSAENRNALTINTSDLQVQLSSAFAKTQAWAEIIDGKHVTEGVGMEVVYQQPIQIKFLSNVRGRYEF